MQSKKKNNKKEVINNYSSYRDSYNLSGKKINKNNSYIEMAKKFKRDLQNNATKAELGLKEYFDSQNINYEFQFPIYISNKQKIEKFYIADFYIPTAKLIIELDGEYHNTKEQQLKDNTRDKELKKKGYLVLRFKNEDVFTPNKILLRMNNLLTERFLKKRNRSK